jgi:hypothetical protein
MSEFFIRPNIASRAATLAATRAATEAAGAGGRIAGDRPSTVFIDVAEEATRAEISRGGFPLGEVAVRPDLITTFLEDLVLVRTKVVSQAVLPGTAVARGTAIDVVIANPSEIPVRVIPNAHVAFENLTMAQLHGRFAENAAVRDIVRRRTKPDDLTANEKQALTTALQEQDVLIDEENPVEKAFTSIQAAFTFLG